jgi:hypothetical protein
MIATESRHPRQRLIMRESRPIPTSIADVQEFEKKISDL